MAKFFRPNPICILYSSNSIPESREANAIQIQRMCAAFAAAEHDVVLTAIGSGPSAEGSFRTIMLRWPVKRLRTRLMQVLTRMCVARLRPHILLTRNPLLAMEGLRGRTRVLLELHALPKHGSRSQEMLHRLICHPSLRRIVTISQALANDLVAEYGPPLPGCDIVVAHDGAQAGPRPGPMPPQDGMISVGYFGHLYPGKGMETIAALAHILPEICFEVFGGTETDLARWRAASAGLANLTLHGHIPHAEVAARMVDCDILIAPYEAEVSHVGSGDIGRWMSPLKLFEYMAAERPIVTSDLPVLREVVRDGETALLCTPGDPAAFAEALRRLAANPALRARLGSAGRDLLEAEYTWDRRARRVLDGLLPLTNA